MAVLGAVDDGDVGHAGQTHLHADGPGCAAGAEDDGFLALDVDAVGGQGHHEALAVGVLAEEASVVVDDHIDRADELRALRDLVQVLHDLDLVRDGAVDAAHLEGLKAVDGVFELVLVHVQRQEMPALQTQGLEGSVLDDDAGVLRDRLAKYADQMVQIVLFFHF